MKKIVSTEYLINKDLNETLNFLSVIEERSLYVLIKELKQEFYTYVVQYDLDGKVRSYEDYDNISEFYISANIMKKAFEKNRIIFNDIIDILENLPMTVIKNYLNGDCERICLFRSIKYLINNDTFKIKLSKEFYDYIYIFVREDEKIDNFFKVYHDEFFKLNSKTSKALYRLASIWSNAGWRNMKFKDFENYFRIKSRNLDKQLNNAIEKINKDTRFNISYSKIKKGKEISNIIFKIEKKKDISSSDDKVI